MSEINNKKHGWLEINFGSRRGFVCAYWHKLLFHAGVYRRYREIDWDSVERLVFVCKGNICRSAYAEAVARSLNLDVISCGVDTIKDAPANESAVRVARHLGVDLTKHRTTPLSEVTFKKNDLLIAMEPWQSKFLCERLKGKYQNTLLGLWASSPLPHIQDPYGLSATYFNKCFTDIQFAVKDIAGKMRQREG